MKNIFMIGNALPEEKINEKNIIKNPDNSLVTV
jgi:hypothetical protein